MDNRKEADYGLIGYPVEHSLSPQMHNAAFKEFKLPHNYSLYPVKPDDFKGFIKSLEEKNIKGLNVTVPYKEKILTYLDKRTKDVAKIGAANTIVLKDNQIKGFNTDFLGFSKDLKETINPANLKVALLGAGGAARAVVYSLLQDKVKSISLFDIDAKKRNNLVAAAKEWASKLDSDIRINQARDIAELDILNKDLLINATPVGLKEEDPLIVDKNFLHKDLVVYDLIYNPKRTKLLSAAKDKGLKYSNGLGMLIYQGAESFLHFTNLNYKLEEVAKPMKEALNKEGI